MIIRSCFWVVTLFVCAGCTMTETHEGQKHLDLSMVNAVQACIDAQLSIANPYWDNQSRRPKQSEVSDYVVEFSHIPTASVYHISIGLINTYPGALLLTCRLDEKTNDVLQVAYYSGESGAGQSKEVSLIDHDPLSGIVETDLDMLINEGKTQSFPLTEFYDEL